MQLHRGWHGGNKDNGTITITYVNGTRRLKFLTAGSNLHAYKVQGGCGSLNGIDDHDHMTLSATGTMAPPQTITSP